MNNEEKFSKIVQFIDPSFSLSFENLIIGSGAGGSTIAKRLTDAGRETCILEEGLLYETSDFSQSTSKLLTKLYRNSGVQPVHGKATIAFGEGSCIGGSTTVNGGLIWRTPKWILDQWNLDGFSDLELQPYFETIEKDLNVVRHQLSDTDNLDSLALARGSDSLGWKYVLVPRAVKSCQNSNRCATGCPTGAKQSMLVSYLLNAALNGASIFQRVKVLSLIKDRNRVEGVIVEDKRTNMKAIIKAKNVFVSAGAIQTPALLQRSKISRTAGSKLELHWNLKLVVRFKEPVYADNGTIFTVQMQEFEREGTLVMGSNFNPSYLGMSLSHLENLELNKILDEKDHYSIFACMIKPESKAKVRSFFKSDPLLTYNFVKSDLKRTKRALRQSLEVLFESGADKIFLPVKGMPPIYNIADYDHFSGGMSAKDLELVSVHAMASCPMGHNDRSSIVDHQGKVWGFDNLYIADASILPSNIGESPQGSIMVFCHKIADAFLN